MAKRIPVSTLNAIAAEYKITDKNALYAFVMRGLIDCGMTAREAMDAVFGAGAYDELAGLVYDDLRAKAVA